MTPVGERVLRALLTDLAGSRRSQDQARAQQVEAILLAEGLDPGRQTSAPPQRSPAAQRQARYRERHSLRHDEASRNGVTSGRVGLDLSSDLEKSEPDHPLDLGGAGGDVTRNADASRDAHPIAPAVTSVTPRRLNATDDGHFGDVVSAWVEGIQLETGQPYARPAAGAVSTLVGALNAHRPSDERDPVAWGRMVAADYARANRGTTLSPFGFTNWINSGKPARARPVNGVPEGSPHDGPQARAEREQRDREHREAKKNRSPPPVGELLAAVGVKRT